MTRFYNNICFICQNIFFSQYFCHFNLFNFRKPLPTPKYETLLVNVYVPLLNKCIILSHNNTNIMICIFTNKYIWVLHVTTSILHRTESILKRNESNVPVQSICSYNEIAINCLVAKHKASLYG